MVNRYILIVDDDPEIREGLTRNIEQEFQGQAEVLNCKNGAIAAELLKYNTIDIVVTDIKMPVMNGIELLQFIKDQHLACKSIVLSSYDDFNLVRDALRLNASDYLLKPVDFSSLHHMLYKLLTQIMLEHNHLNHLTSPINMWKLLEDYLQAPVSKSVEMLAFEEKYGLTEYSSCLLGSIKIQTVSSEKTFKLHELFREDLYNCLNKSHIQYKTILTGEAASCFVFLIFPVTDYDACLNALDFYKNSLSEKGFNIKISEQFHCLKDISFAFQECMTWFELGYYDLPSSFSSSQEKETSELLHKAVQALSTYDIQTTLLHLSHFFSVTNAIKPPVKDTKKVLNNMMYNLIKINPKYIEPLSSSKFTEHDIFHQIENSPSFSLLQKNLFDSLNHLVETVICSLPNREDCVIAKAKAYIEKNYNDCITLEDIAAHVYLNKSYFSVFFKNKVGLNFRDYLRNYRIEKAIELLANTNMKIYEIAQAVGYSDSAHFLRAFKTVTGKKPDTYIKKSLS